MGLVSGTSLVSGMGSAAMPEHIPLPPPNPSPSDTPRAILSYLLEGECSPTVKAKVGSIKTCHLESFVQFYRAPSGKGFSPSPGYYAAV